MPTHRMHMTTLEIDHSRTPADIAALVATLRPSIPTITSHTYSPAHRARLVKPQISYDLSAFAVSFLPAAGEPLAAPSASTDQPTTDGGQQQAPSNDGYTYHHLRRDTWALSSATGVQVASRYQVPSAHITLGRYLRQDGHADPAQRAAWVRAIERANAWLAEEVWGRPAGEWLVGQERGLDARCGALWYGGGRTIQGGEGF